jgi:hypothetical protein
MSAAARPVRPGLRWLAPFVALAVLATALPAEADHPVEGVTFDSRGGNEWWVDVQLGGGYEFYGPPEVRDSNGQWAHMEHPSWARPGQYVLSYHVEPGHLVKFRVTYKSSVVLSCWFTHPAGVEQCDGAETYTATFTPSSAPGGIRLKVDGSQPTSYAYWRVMGTQGSWGGPGMRLLSTSGTTSTWASDVRVPDGEVLMFFAQSGDDWSATAASGCFRWPAVTSVACPRDDVYLSMQPPSSYDGNLSHMEANAYYSAYPDDDPSLVRLDVRFDNGDFSAMRLDRTEYTNTRYYRFDQAPTRPMSVAQFRGSLSDGSTVCEQTAYFWPPQGYPDRVNTGPGQEIIFTGIKGTTGYVQTNLYSSQPVVAVEASVNGGPWTVMQQQAWCDWGVAMQSASGSVVFRGYFPDLTTFTSEAFSWNPSGGTTFGAQFFEVAGNEWWQQVSVNAFGGTLSKVDVRVNGGAWSPLSKQTWGNNMWAGSYRAVQGSTVQFQVTSTAGDKAVSPCYQWLPAKPAQTTACTTAPPPPPPGFDATFSGVKGNDWWVQANVAATGGTLAGVDARVNCGTTWKPLAKQDWGGWAASFNIPAGAKVDFRARSTAGASDLSGGYIWPNATPTSSC